MPATTPLNRPPTPSEASPRGARVPRHLFSCRVVFLPLISSAGRGTGGFAASQIVLGLPAYGYVSKSQSTTLRQFVDPSALPVIGLASTSPTSRGKHVKFDGPRIVPVIHETQPSTTDQPPADEAASKTTEAAAPAETGGPSDGVEDAANGTAESGCGENELVGIETAAKGDLSGWAGQQVNFKDMVRCHSRRR